jgi:membrane associated rhomboid family serine protease
MYSKHSLYSAKTRLLIWYSANAIVALFLLATVVQIVGGALRVFASPPELKRDVLEACGRVAAKDALVGMALGAFWFLLGWRARSKRPTPGPP